MAPLSVHSPGRGTRTRMPYDEARSSASTRSREFAATPPPMRMSSMPSERAASIALRVSTSQTASWKDAATSATGTGSPEASRACTHRATADLRPENEKSKRCRSRSRREVSPRGKSMATEEPDRAARSMCGTARERQAEQTRDLVERLPRRVVDGGSQGLDGGGHVVDPEQRGVAARDEHGQARDRAADRARAGRPPRVRRGGSRRTAASPTPAPGTSRRPPRRAAHRPAPVRPSRRWHPRRPARCARSRTRARASAPSPRGARARPPRARLLRTGRAPRPRRPRRPPAACGPARCRYRSRRTRSRCRAPGVRPVVRRGSRRHCARPQRRPVAGLSTSQPRR